MNLAAVVAVLALANETDPVTYGARVNLVDHMCEVGRLSQYRTTNAITLQNCVRFPTMDILQNIALVEYHGAWLYCTISSRVEDSHGFVIYADCKRNLGNTNPPKSGEGK